MAEFIGRNRKARTTYGFDEIALVPGRVTINPNEVDITFGVPRRNREPLRLAIPILASAMDGVVDVNFAIEMGKLGGLAVLNLEGIQTRYKNPREVLLKVLEADKEHVTGLLQKIYLEPVQEEPQIVVKKGPPWQVEFRRKEEEGACLRLDGLVLWHASYIGPRSAEKSENQDATFAITSLEMSSPPYLVFALADGVTTSMGSRLAATSIVRRFCELVLQHMNKDEMVSASDLIEAARKTQVSLDELTKTLLSEANSYVFDAVRGSGLQRSAAARVLENTLDPRVAAMPAALMATLIGGIVQRNNILGVIFCRIKLKIRNFFISKHHVISMGPLSVMKIR